MPYSMSNVPQWASKKTDAVKKVAIEVFNSTLKSTGSEEKSRIASLAAMQNAEEEFKSRAKGKVNKSSKSVEDILKAKYELK